jgi:Na+-translocating ferredoxin:NAD+ oxidoreductase subunit G
MTFDRATLRKTVLLAVLTILGTVLLALTNNVTRAVIIKREDEEKMQLVNQLLPPGSYDNRLLRDTIRVSENEALGTGEVTIAYRARLRGAPSAALFEAVSPNGYGGKIRIIAAVNAKGELHGVRVLSHNETVGWGDYIEIAKSKWIRMFEATSLSKYTEKQWQVRKDGGRFDYVTRATISARAMVEASHSALKYYAAHKEQLFSNARTIE